MPEEVTPTKEELLAEYVTLLNIRLTAQESSDFAQAPPLVQQQIILNAAGEDWSPPSADTGTKVLAVIATLAAIGANVSGIAGAASALRAS